MNSEPFTNGLKKEKLSFGDKLLLIQELKGCYFSVDEDAREAFNKMVISLWQSIQKDIEGNE